MPFVFPNIGEILSTRFGPGKRDRLGIGFDDAEPWYLPFDGRISISGSNRVVARYPSRSPGGSIKEKFVTQDQTCLLYTSDAADE